MELFTFTKPDVCTDATLKKTKEGEKSLWSAASVSLGQAASKNSWYYFCWLFLFKIPIYQYNDITSLKQYNSFFYFTKLLLANQYLHVSRLVCADLNNFSEHNADKYAI